jgi:glycine/D-amino acid oxidase-like deaminating enzyme
MIDCVVVGAGPAGLAASVALAARGVDHVVLERDRPGESWRSQRWDSFRLNTPGWMNRLLGEQAPDAYLTGTQVVERLERLAAAAPVRAGVPVTRLAPTGDGYLLRTGDGELRARAVVVATGDQNRPADPGPGRRRRLRRPGPRADRRAHPPAGLDALPAEPDPSDAPVDLDPPAELDLRDQDIGSVVWCTGFGGDFAWIDPALRDGDGQPRRVEAAAVTPGLAYLGLRWLIRRGSGILFGFPQDAAVVADGVKAHLDS